MYTVVLQHTCGTVLGGTGTHPWCGHRSQKWWTWEVDRTERTPKKHNHMIRFYIFHQEPCLYGCHWWLFSLLDNLQIVVMLNPLVYKKSQKIGKIFHHNFLEPNVMSSNCCFCPQFKRLFIHTLMTKNCGKTLTFKKIEPAHFCPIIKTGGH